MTTDLNNYDSYHTNHISFISDALTSSKPALVIFYEGDWDKSIVPSLSLIMKYKERVPSLPLFFYDTSIPKNVELAQALGIENSPTFVIFKNGNMNRWHEEGRKVKINEKNLLKFLGSPALYGVDKEEAKQIMDEFTAKLKKEAKMLEKLAPAALDKKETQSAKPKTKKATIAPAASVKKLKR